MIIIILLNLHTDVCASETQEGSNLWNQKFFAKKLQTNAWKTLIFERVMIFCFYIKILSSFVIYKI